MAPSKLAALIVFVAIPLSVALPKCLEGQFQVGHMVFSCTGAGGSLETNTVKVMAPAGAETILATIPRGTRNFQAVLRAPIDADLYIKDVSARHILYSKDGADGVHQGVYEGLHFQILASTGLPTVETVTFFNATSKHLQLVVKSHAANSSVVSVGYHYDSWSSSEAEACPWIKEPVGCSPFKQADMETAGLAFSKWLGKLFGGCDQAWGAIGAPNTGDASEVPYYKWPQLFNTWPAVERPNIDGVSNLASAMYKFVTGGGLEANKRDVLRSQFMWTCKLEPMRIQFIDPCCSKLQTAFKDENDAWWKLSYFANENGHLHPQNGLWEVCRNLPNAPTSGRNDLFRFFNADADRTMVASDLKFCYPSGPVIVQPTTEPLVAPASLNPASGYGERGRNTAGGMYSNAKQPWEDDGVPSTTTPAAVASTTAGAVAFTTPAAVASTTPAAVAFTTPAVVASTTLAAVAFTTPAAVASTTPVGSAEDGPRFVINRVDAAHPESNVGVPAPFRREAMLAKSTVAGTPTTTTENTMGGMRIMLLAAACGCICCAGALSGLVYLILRDRSRKSDRVNYLESDGRYQNQHRAEDEENLLGLPMVRGGEVVGS